MHLYDGYLFSYCIFRFVVPQNYYFSIKKAENGKLILVFPSTPARSARAKKTLEPTRVTSSPTAIASARATDSISP